MNFKVILSPVHEPLLTALSLGARDRMAITEAVDRLDAAFRGDPFSIGESRDGDDRVGFVGPMAFLSRTTSDGGSFYIKDIWRTH